MKTKKPKGQNQRWDFLPFPGILFPSRIIGNNREQKQKQKTLPEAGFLIGKND
jgi:hypothetical protein